MNFCLNRVKSDPLVRSHVQHTTQTMGVFTQFVLAFEVMPD